MCRELKTKIDAEKNNTGVVELPRTECKSWELSIGAE